MPKISIKETRNKLAKFYGIGVVVFTAIVGFITVFATFLARLNLT